jgi:hypothetical protein
MKTQNKVAIFFTVLIILSLGISVAWGDEKHHKSPANNYQIKGVASAISAAQCHFDGGSNDLQLCGAHGNAFNSDAFTVGAGYKVGDFLLNATRTIENGDESYGFGVNYKIKFK